MGSLLLIWPFVWPHAPPLAQHFLPHPAQLRSHFIRQDRAAVVLCGVPASLWRCRYLKFPRCG